MPSTDRSQRLLIGGTLAIIVVIAAAVATPAIGYHLRPSSDPAAVEAADHATTALTEVPAYRVAVDGRVTARDGDRTASADLDGRVLVNASARRVSTSARVADGNADHFGDSDRLYVEDYTAYRPCPFSRYGNVENASYGVSLPRDRSWRSYGFLGGLGAVFDVAKLYDEGVTTVDGVRARELRVVVNPRKVDDLAARSPDLGEGSDRSGVGSVRSFANADIRVWVATDTGLPRKVVVEAERGGLGQPEVQGRFVYRVSYESVTVPRPNATVESKSLCPGP